MKITALSSIALLALATVGIADPDEKTEPAPIVVAQATPPTVKPVPAEAAKPKTDADEKPERETIDATVSGEYEEDEDSFIPSQEVSSDQSLNFPIDI